MQRLFYSVILLCCIGLTGLLAQTPGSGDLSRIPVLALPALDNAALLAEEMAARAPGRAPHFAQPRAVDVSPATGGAWTDLDNGVSVWRLRVQSPNAISLNFGFTEYWMPRNGKLYLYAGGQKEPKVYGPFTPADNEVHDQLWTQVIEGDDLVIEVQLPTSEKSNLRLRLTSVNHDFLGFGANQSISGSCNLDVVCEAADGWGIVDQYRDIIRSVAVIATGGGTFCTGFLVSNVRQDCTPYFMTANHCGIGAGNAPSLVTYWNYENSICRQPGSPASGGNGDGQLNTFNTGATWRASYPAGDMTIVEMDDPINPDANAFFAGWSREEPAPGDTVIAIHHPSTDEKRISFSFQQTYRVDGISPNPDPNGNQIAVPDWDIGTTEGGSSGSPLFDRFKRVRGQLFGGAAACGNDSYDSYGYFFSSWEGGGTPSTRLKDWLDPDNTGVMFIDGREQLACQISVSTPSASATVCAGNSITYDLLVGGGFTNQVTLSIPDLPAELNATFSQNPVAPNTNITLTVTYDAGFTGDASFTVFGNDGTNNSTTTLNITVEAAPPAAPAAISPANGSTNAPTSVTLNWEDVGALNYEYEFATDAGFTNVLANGVVEMSSFFYDQALDMDTQYFWRVRAANTCGFGPWSQAYSFSTLASLVCAPPVFSQDVNVPISASGTPTAFSGLNVETTGVISFMTVDIDIAHTYVGDLRITLTSPAGTEVTLLDRIGTPPGNFGCSGDNLLLTFSDDAVNTAADLEATCGNDPAAQGVFNSVDPLATFNGEDQFGDWLLTVVDNENQDGGTIFNWSIVFCGAGGGMSDYSVTVLSDPISACANDGGLVSLQLGEDFGEDFEVAVSVSGQPQTGFTQTFDGGSNVLDLDFDNFITLASGNYSILVTITAEDGTSQSGSVALTIEPVPGIANQISPANGAILVDNSVDFTWAAAANAEDYTLQVSTDETFATIDRSETTTATSLTLGSLDLTGLLYWRVVANNECGNATSSPFNFTIDPNGVHSFADGRSLLLFPNPANGAVFLEMQGNWNGELEVSIMSVRGRVLSAQRLNAGGRHALDISRLPAGTYLVDMRNGNERTVERLVILP